MVSISIVTPSFNQRAYLDACLQSVAAQRVRPVEHVIYDPGSTDGSRDVAAAYADAHEWATLVAEPDDGQVDAINRGLEAATGDVLTWLNSDDSYVDDRVLEIVVKAFEANPDVDVVYGGGEYVSPEGEKLKNAFVHRDPVALPKLLHNSIGILQPALFFRRSLFERVGGLNPYYNLSLDYDYWVRFAQAGATWHYIDRLFARATMHNDSKTMGSRGPQYQEILELQQEHFDTPHPDWIDRWSVYRTTGRDGIIDSSTEMTFGQRAAQREHHRFIRGEYISGARQQRHVTVVTSFDQHYFEQGLNLIAGLHRTSQDVIDEILVYDLDLTPEQRELVDGLEATKVIDFPDQMRSNFDGYFDPKNYSYKCGAVLDAGRRAPEGGVVLWIDAGVAPLQSMLPVIEKIESDGVFFVDHDDRPGWPLRNGNFTSAECADAMAVTTAELLALHLCSCLMGYVENGPFRELFEQAYAFSTDPTAVVGAKHLDKPIRPATDPASVAAAQALVANPARGVDVDEIHRLFGYYGHRQDQSIYSILAARHGAPISSATRYCRANQASSEASKANWESGRFSDTVAVGRSNLDDMSADTVTYHHRGTLSNLDGLRRDARRSDCLFVLGNGPSLADVDLTSLDGLDTVGMNAAYRYWNEIGWYPRYYMCCDSVVVMSHANEIHRLVIESDTNGIQGFLLREEILSVHPDLEHHPRVILLEREAARTAGFDVEPVTTGSHSLVWGRSMGYRRIFLLGIDLGYVEQVDGSTLNEEGTLEIVADAKNPNYFFDGYQRPGDRYNVPNPNAGLHGRAWQAVQRALPPHVDVINLNPTSELKDFSFGDLDDARREAQLASKTSVPMWKAPIAAKPAADALVGPFARGAANVEEVHLIRSLFHRVGDGGKVMVDVGAHVGGSLRRFAETGWKVWAFEPDPSNRGSLLENVQDSWDVNIDTRAVSSVDGKVVPFYASKESTGVSGLEPFLDSHKPVAEVETVSLREFAADRGIDQIDFLKIDTEGHDLSVLEGVDWARWRPRVVLCEFEDRKTMRLGYRTDELVAYLQALGYHIVISEWHPVVRYGIKHDFHRLVPWTGEERSDDVWGNVVAFAEAEHAEAFTELAREQLANITPAAGAAAGASPAATASARVSGSRRGIVAKVRSMAGRIWSRRRAITRRLVKWYLSPSGVPFLGMLAAVAWATAGAPGARIAGLVALALAAIFVPYKFGREQVRSDRRLQVAQAGLQRGVQLAHDRVARVERDIESRSSELDAMQSGLGAARAELDAMQSGLGAAGAELEVMQREAAAMDAQLSELPAMVAEEVSSQVVRAVGTSIAAFAVSQVEPSGDVQLPATRSDDPLVGRRAVFCATSGRSGSQYLANLLACGEYVYSVHEAAPFMTGHNLAKVLDRPAAETYADRRIKADVIRSVVAGLPRGWTYAETNHMFIKTFADVVLNEFDPTGLSVVVLRRSLDQVLKSLLDLGYFTSSNDDWRHWMHVATGPQVLAHAPAPIDEHDDVDRAIGYLFDIEARQQAFVRDNPGINVVEVRLPEIQSVDGASRLLADLRIKATDRVSEVAGRPSNQRAVAKSGARDIADLRRRITGYHRRATDQGLWVPDLDAVLD
jgi:FkbM family methyltransferase